MNPASAAARGALQGRLRLLGPGRVAAGGGLCPPGGTQRQAAWSSRASGGSWNRCRTPPPARRGPAGNQGFPAIDEGPGRSRALRFLSRREDP